MFRSMSSFSAGELSELENFLVLDSIPNVYLLSDVENRDHRAEVIMSRYQGKITGVLLRLNFPEYPVFWLVGDKESSNSLVSRISDLKFVMIAEDISFLEGQLEWKEARVYPENVMCVYTHEANFVPHESVRLLVEKDAEAFSRTMKVRSGDIRKLLPRARKRIRENDCFGYFLDRNLVSRGSIDAKSRHGWAIGGIYTSPEYRNMGFATALVSGLVSYASGKAEKAILFVRDDNLPAIRTYTKIGFKNVSKRYFVDCNTGTIP